MTRHRMRIVSHSKTTLSLGEVAAYVVTEQTCLGGHYLLSGGGIHKTGAQRLVDWEFMAYKGMCKVIY